MSYILPDMPPLSREEELDLIARAQAGCAKASNKLACAHLHFAASFIRKNMRFRCRDEGDMLGAAHIAFMVALRDFDPAFGCRFCTYYGTKLRAELGIEVERSESLAGRQTTLAQGKARRYLREHESEIGDAQQLAGGAGVTLRVAQVALHHQDKSASLDFQYDNSRSYHESVASDALSPEEIADAQRRERTVRAAIEQLSPQEQTVIKMRYYRERTGPDIGQELRVTRQRVDQIQDRAQEHLRKALVAPLELGAAPPPPPRPTVCAPAPSLRRVRLPKPRTVPVPVPVRSLPFVSEFVSEWTYASPCDAPERLETFPAGHRFVARATPAPALVIPTISAVTMLEASSWSAAVADVGVPVMAEGTFTVRMPVVSEPVDTTAVEVVDGIVHRDLKPANAFLRTRAPVMGVIARFGAIGRDLPARAWHRRAVPRLELGVAVARTSARGEARAAATACQDLARRLARSDPMVRGSPSPFLARAGPIIAECRRAATSPTAAPSAVTRPPSARASTVSVLADAT